MSFKGSLLLKNLILEYVSGAPVGEGQYIFIVGKYNKSVEIKSRNGFGKLSITPQGHWRVNNITHQLIDILEETKAYYVRVYKNGQYDREPLESYKRGNNMFDAIGRGADIVKIKFKRGMGIVTDDINFRMDDITPVIDELNKIIDRIESQE